MTKLSLANRAEAMVTQDRLVLGAAQDCLTFSLALGLALIQIYLKQEKDKQRQPRAGAPPA